MCLPMWNIYALSLLNAVYLRTLQGYLEEAAAHILQELSFAK